MTLVLTAISRSSVVQLSDRRLTLPAGQPFDQAANKAVLFCAADAQVALGYSGTAYIDGITTDRWIAEILWGSPMADSRRGGPAVLRVSGKHKPLGIGTAVEKVRAKLAAQKGVRIEVFLAGWKLHKNKGWRPMWINLKKGGGTPGVSIEKSERYFYWAPHFPDHTRVPHYIRTLHLTPEHNPLSAAEIEVICEQIAAVGDDVGARIELLWNAIRLAARNSPVVGDDCMSIHLPYPAFGDAEVAFHSARTHRVRVNHREVLPVTYTPWIIGPQVMAAPAVTDGTYTVPFGWNRVAVCPVPSPATHGLQILSSQPRPAWP